MLIKKVLGSWTLFEKLFLFFSLITITLCFAFGIDKNIFAYIVSIVGVISVLLVAKGLAIAPIIYVIYSILYSVLSISQRYYGEAIIYLGLMIPISVISIVSWLKNRNKAQKEVVSVNSIKGKEYLYLSIATVVATIGFYFILKVLNTSELIISTLSLVSSAVASYLMLRRCSYYAIGFIVNDIILIMLWILAVVSSGIGYLPSAISFCIFLINDIYGFIHWKIEEHKQNKADIF
ncbi:MAG: nicotinamide mononucleotide transporter [Clostridia bacterium]|nr:nicotinamide mononucleotide transporter [Clostridia bacterium]